MNIPDVIYSQCCLFLLRLLSTENQPQGGSKHPIEDSEQDARYNILCKGIILCVPYAANIGGTATLTGTAPNLVLAGQIER